MINQIWRSRVVLPTEPELKELVHEVVAATTDIAQLKQTIEDLKGQLADLDEQLAERTFKSGPYSSVWQRVKPETKDQWYSFIQIVVTILVGLLAFMPNNQQSEAPTKELEQQIVAQLQEVHERMEEHQEQEIEQLKQINEHLAEAEAKEDAKPSKPKEHH
jgi:peptidoglycan hydrolase CwlO-like protein